MSRKILGPVTRTKLEELQALVGKCIEASKEPDKVVLWMSIAEYLKDAARWQYVMAHGLILNSLSEMTPDEVLKFVDKELAK